MYKLDADDAKRLGYTSNSATWLSACTAGKNKATR